MKRTFLLLCLVFAGFALYAANPAVAVLDFESNNYCTAQNAVVMTDLFRNELVRSGRADIVDRRNIERIKTELKFQNSDYVDPARMKRFGQMIGADILMIGNFNMLGNRLFLIVEMLDVETARITYSDRMYLNSWEEYDRKVKEFAASFISRFPKAEIFSGTWTSIMSYEGAINSYEITFTGKGRCMVKIESDMGSQEAQGTYTYDGTVFSLNVVFRNAQIPNQGSIQWSSVLTFNESNSAFNILAKPAVNASQVRATFTKQE